MLTIRGWVGPHVCAGGRERPREIEPTNHVAVGPEFADGCYLGPYSTRRRRLSSITLAPCRKVMGVRGQRSQAARNVASAT